MKFNHIYTLLQNSRKIDEFFIIELEKLIMFTYLSVFKYIAFSILK